MEISSHNVFSDASFSGPNIQVSQNRVKSAFKALRTYALLSKYDTWVSGSWWPSCRVTEQNLSFEILALRLQLF